MQNVIKEINTHTQNTIFSVLF